MPYTQEEQAYIDSLSEKEKLGFDIAKDHLGCTFHVQKSIGFNRWKAAREAAKQTAPCTPTNCT